MALGKSTFRARFHLRTNEQRYLRKKTLPVVLQHASEFLHDRLAPARPKNDVKQTPMQGHPVFVAQHATATCCRGFLGKWHAIPMHVDLNDEQMDYLLAVLSRWLETQCSEVFTEGALKQ
ncbi:MAG: DUF4186 domain-containing protein [Pirellulales bacterium]|nr:DUF4186 domain-containing protein [Pirellulales bacterium]